MLLLFIFDYISARSYFDSAIEVMQNNKENAAILNYAIKALPVESMSKQAKTLCVKTIFHLCLLYPYLVHIMDEHVFRRFEVEKSDVEAFTNLLFKQEHRLKNYDAVCYSIYFSLKFGFPIEQICAQDAINSDSTIYKLLSFLYFKRENNTAERAALRAHAVELKKNDEDFDRNWLFVYEVLPQSDLPGDWKKIKQSGVSFVDKKLQL